MEIYNQMNGRTCFAFINTCMSSNLTYGNGFYYTGTEVGMPFAITHNRVGIDMSSDGYNNPWGPSCYIGFPYGSASLSNIVDPQHPSTYYWMWVYAFFYYALNNDWSINTALDQASLMCFNSAYGSTALHNDFSSIWEGVSPPEGVPHCTMTVYGNGNIHLLTPQACIDVSALGYYMGQWFPGAVDVTIDGQYAGNTNYGSLDVPVSPGYHNVSIPATLAGYYFDHFDGCAQYQNEVTVYVGSGSTVGLTGYYLPT
jgi:hypothetical protein